MLEREIENVKRKREGERKWGKEKRNRHGREGKRGEERERWRDKGKEVLKGREKKKKSNRKW